ncbi:MAG: electron transport complex subunit RsxC [Clostridia bacterium]|nr:electron transport complex subunit RsxC [Clostridia bacterium]
MQKGEKILKPKKKIKGGARLPHLKHTAEMESVYLENIDQVIIPMQQHIGAPCNPLVKKGDKVFVGTLIGDCDAKVSAPIHSSVSGEVSQVKTITLSNGNECQAVIINSDGQMTPDPELSAMEVTNAEDLRKAARNCGLVGLGGAGFPTHVKLTLSDDKPIDTLIINGAECEPYITADYRECIESFEDILEGVYLIKNALNVENVIIGVEDNKPKAIKLLYDIASHKNDTENHVRLMKLPSSYPQGAEKVLIYSATGRKLPAGKLPADVGCIVMNITSVAVLKRYIKTGMPLVNKRLTVDGNAVEKPGNYIVPVGTPINKVLEAAGAEDFEKIILGGPMMGQAIYNTEAPITKQNNAILAFKGIKALTKPTTDCIRCGRCMKACPIRLSPRKVETALEFGAGAEELSILNTMHCIECGSCSFSCPAGRQLTASMRLAKNVIRKAGAK